MQGDVSIPYDGAQATLKCTLGAAIKICDYFGNFVDAHKRVMALDLNAISVVVAAGLDKEPKDVREHVWAAGLLEIHEPVGRYLNFLANGGREPKKPATEAGGAESGKP